MCFPCFTIIFGLQDFSGNQILGHLSIHIQVPVFQANLKPGRELPKKLHWGNYSWLGEKLQQLNFWLHLAYWELLPTTAIFQRPISRLPGIIFFIKPAPGTNMTDQQTGICLGTHSRNCSSFLFYKCTATALTGNVLMFVFLNTDPCSIKSFCLYMKSVRTMF